MTGMTVYLYYEGPKAQLIISICVCSFVCYVHFFFFFCQVAAMLPFVNNVNKHYSIDYYCFLCVFCPFSYMWEIFVAFVCLSMSGGFAHSSTDDSVTSFPQDVVGVKCALHFESDDEDICVTKVSKKDDCICTCCRKTHLERPMCHIFSVRKYDVSNAEE